MISGRLLFYYICTAMKVLLFGSMGDISQTAEKALKADGHEVVAVPFPQNVQRDASGYERELLKASRAFSPDAILPVGNTVNISMIRASHPELPPVMVDSVLNTTLLDSKISASRIAAELGIPQPRIYKTIDEVESFPVILKRDVSFGGSGVYKPSSPEALKRITEHFAGKEFIIEEYIEGTDWSVDAVRFGDCFRYGCYISLSNRGQGPSLTRKAAGFPLLGKYAEMILEAVDYRGVCGMDFRVERDGKPFFLECNPRLTGGLATQIEAGFNIPTILVRHI